MHATPLHESRPSPTPSLTLPLRSSRRTSPEGSTTNKAPLTEDVRPDHHHHRLAEADREVDLLANELLKHVRTHPGSEANIDKFLASKPKPAVGWDNVFKRACGQYVLELFHSEGAQFDEISDWDHFDADLKRMFGKRFVPMESKKECLLAFGRESKSIVAHPHTPVNRVNCRSTNRIWHGSNRSTTVLQADNLLRVSILYEALQTRSTHTQLT